MQDLISRRAAIDAIADYLSKTTYTSAISFLNVGALILARVPSAQSGQRWIPVSERLPEYGIQVLTTDKDGDFELNHIIDEDDEEWFFDGAIAWCELPEPWKGDSDG